MFDQAPKWFLSVAITALLALMPVYIAQDRRMAVLETRVEVMEVARKDEGARVIAILDRMDVSVDKLAEAVSALQTEVKYIKEH